MDIRQLQVADAPVYRAFRLRGLREHPDAFTSSFEEESLRQAAHAPSTLTLTLMHMILHPPTTPQRPVANAKGS